MAASGAGGQRLRISRQPDRPCPAATAVPVRLVRARQSPDPAVLCRRSGAVFVEDTNSAIALVAAFEQIGNGQVVQILERFHQTRL